MKDVVNHAGALTGIYVINNPIIADAVTIIPIQLSTQFNTLVKRVFSKLGDCIIQSTTHVSVEH